MWTSCSFRWVTRERWPTRAGGLALRRDCGSASSSLPEPPLRETMVTGYREASLEPNRHGRLSQPDPSEPAPARLTHPARTGMARFGRPQNTSQSRRRRAAKTAPLASQRATRPPTLGPSAVSRAAATRQPCSGRGKCRISAAIVSIGRPL